MRGLRWYNIIAHVADGYVYVQSLKISSDNWKFQWEIANGSIGYHHLYH